MLSRLCMQCQIFNNKTNDFDSICFDNKTKNLTVFWITTLGKTNAMLNQN